MTTVTTTTTTTATRQETKTHDGHRYNLWKRFNTHPRFQKLRRRYTRFTKDFNQLQPHQKALFITFISIVFYVIIRNVWFVSLDDITQNVHVKVFVDEPLCKILNIQPSSSSSLEEKNNLPFSPTEEIQSTSTCPFKACNAYTKVVTLNETQALIKLTEESRKCEDLTTCCAVVHCIPRKNNEEIRYPIDGCYSLKDSTDIQPSVYTDVLETQCHDLCDNRRITNFHPLLPLTPKVEQKLQAWRTTQGFKSLDEIPRVIFIVLDHVSRNQAEKYLPQTLETLRSSKWGNYHDFRGYSMVDETTEGNFLGALTGFNTTSLSAKCSFSHYGYFDGCPWIWKEFRNMDYITSYVDESSLKDSSTFSPLSFMGDFVAQPTDYFVPATFIHDKMQWNQLDDELFNAFASTSPKDFLLSHTSTFYRKFASYPYFSTMRLNSDSDSVATTTSLKKLDSKLSNLFKVISKVGEKNSLVIFASHTGLKTSFSDLNLFDKNAFQHQRPFLFVSVPKSLKEFEHNLLVNSNRLTTVFDVHETFRQVALHSCQLLGSTLDECILHLNQQQHQQEKEENGHTQKSKKEENKWGISLLQPISSIRNCDIAGIPHSICPCVNLPVSSSTATTAKIIQSSYHYKIHELSTARK